MNTEEQEPPSASDISDAVLCSIRKEHPNRNGCHYCSHARTYAHTKGIYGIGMYEYDAYMGCSQCKRATPIPCEAHTTIASKLGHLSEQQMSTVFKIHAIFCPRVNCPRILCNYYKAKMAAKFDGAGQSIEPIKQWIESLKK